MSGRPVLRIGVCVCVCVLRVCVWVVKFIYSQVMVIITCTY